MSVTVPVPDRVHRHDSLLLIMLVVSAAFHGGALYAGYRWGDCLCRIGKVVCPKICFEPESRIDLELEPPPPPPTQPKPIPKPQVVAPKQPDKPLAAPSGDGWCYPTKR